MFELLATVDPFSALLGSLWLFAAGLFPVGFMLGSSCSPCCSPCPACAEGSLPETLTVAFSGIPETTKGPDLATLTFSSCYGSGASGSVTAPGQSAVGGNPADDRGPITAVSLTSGGGGYAKLGRVAPTVSVTGTIGGEGTGATFDVTLATSKDSCGLDRWAVSKVTITGGEGYSDGESLTFSVAEGDTEEASAFATIQLGRVAPTVTVTSTSGSGTGATFDVTLAQSQDSNGRDQWAVSKVTMTGGTGYGNYDSLTFGFADGDTEEQAASAQIIIGRGAPTLTLPGNATGTVSTQRNGDAYSVTAVTVTYGGSGYTDGELLIFDKAADDVTVFNATAIARVAYTEPQNATVSVSSTGGSGAVFSLAWQLMPTPPQLRPNIKVYRPIVTITNGGTGYADYDQIFISFPSPADGREEEYVYIDADIVGPNGEIQQIYMDPTDGGLYRGAATDALDSVELGQGGSYYKDDPDAREVLVTYGGAYYREDQDSKLVTIIHGGAYYREDASLPPYIATVTVGIDQTAPSQGSGASISATVDSDTASETFGQITGLTINNGGDGYLAYELFQSCLGRFNGRSIVVKRNYPFWYPPNCCPFFPISLSPDACTYGYVCANTGDPCSLEAEAVRVEYRGPNEPMTVFLMLHQRGQTTLPLGGDYYYPAAYGLLAAQENVDNCSELDVAAYGSPETCLHPACRATEGGVAHITAGGEYVEVDACKRITEEDMAAVYVDVSWGDVTASGSGSLCGHRSEASSGNSSADTTGPWCEEWKETAPARVAANGYTAGGLLGIVIPDSLIYGGANCSESQGIAGVFYDFARSLYGCTWGWHGSHVCVSVSRQLSVSWSVEVFDIQFNRIGQTASGSRTCTWCYPIIEIPTDDNYIPSGEAVLGEPTYNKGSGPIQQPSIWFDNLLSEDSVCVNPGPPTITFSQLP